MFGFSKKEESKPEYELEVVDLVPMGGEMAQVTTTYHMSCGTKYKKLTSIYTLQADFPHFTMVNPGEVFTLGLYPLEPYIDQHKRMAIDLLQCTRTIIRLDNIALNVAHISAVTFDVEKIPHNYKVQRGRYVAKSK